MGEVDINMENQNAVETEVMTDFESMAIDLKVKLEEEHNNYLRALADAENIRKNYAKKQNDLYEFRYEPLMSDFLDALDDIERGRSANEFSEGGMLIFSKIENLLNKHGLKKIEINPGDEFDAETMDAIASIPNESMSGKVVDCTQNGYSYNNKIIRFPKVVVGQ